MGTSGYWFRVQGLGGYLGIFVVKGAIMESQDSSEVDSENRS